MGAVKGSRRKRNAGRGKEREGWEGGGKGKDGKGGVEHRFGSFLPICVVLCPISVRYRVMQYIMGNGNL